MKLGKYISLTIISLVILTPYSCFTQTCFPDGINFTTQEQIDAFSVDYPGCSEILGYVTIGGVVNDDIFNLDGLNQIHSIGGYLDIRGNLALTSISGLQNLDTVGVDLFVFNNPVLESLAGLNNVSYVPERLYIAYNPALANFAGLENITHVGTYLAIIGNAGLLNLDALSHLTFIGTGLHVEGNSLLSNLNGLSNVNSFGEYITLLDNTSLANINGLANAGTTLTNLEIRNNIALTNIDALEHITTLTGFLTISGNNSLSNINGLSNLSQIGGDLRISANSFLSNLNGLSNLTSINGHIQISYNNTLTSLTGLDNIDSETITELAIYNCSHLSGCEAQSICAFLENDGMAIISNNAFGCNTIDEVLNACQSVSVNEPAAFDHSIAIYPNPTSGVLQIIYPENEKANVKVRNALGALVQTHYTTGNSQIDISNLPNGLYFVEFQSGGNIATKRIIKGS